MNKTAIKNFAVWARRELIARVTKKALEYGISEDNIVSANAEAINGKLLTPAEMNQRKELIKKINDEGFSQVMEEAAYTWFNRFAALRYMEVNGYLPTHIRVFTDEQNNFKPQIITEAIHLEMDGLDMQKVYDYLNKNKTDELYKYLLISQCNALCKLLPGMFTSIEDYTTLLFPDNLLREGSVIEQMISKISEDDWKDIEIIGWLYQFYISEKHENVVNILKGNVKKEDIPAATALFTTDWVVKYIVDNSLGRYWIERNPDSNLADYMEFFVTPKHGSIVTVNEKINPEDIKFLDPCMGSGHFLVYAFELFMHIYAECGWSEREAAKSIIQNNLYGLDIDDRSAQLAYFALMMKARQYNRRIMNIGVEPNVASVKESPAVSENMLAYIGRKTSMKARLEIEKLLGAFVNGKEIGSIAVLPELNIDLIESAVNTILDSEADDLLAVMYRKEIESNILPLLKQAKIMSQRYEIVDTNPPYLNKFDTELKNFINKNYKEYGSDLFSVFIYKNFFYCRENGYTGFMTPFVWMFIKSYEELRKYIISEKSIATLIQFEYSAFEEATVPICSFVLKNGRETGKGLYFRLSDFKGGMNVQRDKVLEALKNVDCKYFYEVRSGLFKEIPSYPIAYWINKNIFDAFKNAKQLECFGDAKVGLQTGNNNLFLKLWFEVQFNKISFNSSDGSYVEWVPYNKGGDFRRWYGNGAYVLDWRENGNPIKQYDGSYPRNTGYYFKEGFSWSDVSCGIFSIRYFPSGYAFDTCAPTLFVNDDRYYLLSLLNTKVAQIIMDMMSPTIHYTTGATLRFPVWDRDNEDIEDLSKTNIKICKDDWDSFETSWDFIKHPLIDVILKYGLRSDSGNIHLDDCYEYWKKECNDRYAQLKANEEELNRIFIDIYGLQDELTPEVEDKDVTVRKADLQRDIKALISYAVGCMFGRYSLDVPSLAYAGGDWDDGKYSTYIPDKDNIIPICDDEYFDDDIVGRFIKFIETVYGEDALEENLKFIADALGGTGSARDVIRKYFLNDFFKDHCNTYSVTGSGKRPIYWLFDSGKKNGFKALIYMHRYQPDTIARMRTDYVHEQQSRYRTAIETLENQVAGASSTSEKVKLQKQLTKLNDQAEELRKYEEKIHNLADQMISIDLDDGVKHNYAIFSDVLAPIK